MDFFRRYRLLSFGLLSILFLLLVGKVILPLSLRAASPLGDINSAGGQNQGNSSDSTIPGSDNGTSSLSSEIDYFLDNTKVGAAGYLVWQYSGQRNNPFANDQYSFFKNDSLAQTVCQTLQVKAAQYPGKFLGVNMNDLARHPDQLDDALSYLHDQCGTTMIRIWGTPPMGGPSAVKHVLDTAQAHGIRVIVVAMDLFPELGSLKDDPIQWYSGKYAQPFPPDFPGGQGYLDYLRQLTSVIGGHPALYAIELANEPHCGGNVSCVDPYIGWVSRSSATIKSVSGQTKVGIGQMASNNLGRGDSPGPGDYLKSNAVTTVDVASGHYYDLAQRAVVIQAANQAKQLGKPFYIGEAPPVLNKTPESSNNYFEFNIQRTDSQKILNNFYDEYSVACLPKEEYKFAGDTRNCEATEKGGCVNWNVTGELDVSAAGKLFGLFRNEAQVNQRYASNNPPTDRLESIEAFLSTKSPTAPSAASTNSSTNTSSPGSNGTTTNSGLNSTIDTTKTNSAAGASTNGAGSSTQDLSVYQAPLYKLTTIQQQCQFAVNKLRAVDELCKPQNRIEGDKTDCSLDTKIPGSSYTHTQLLSQINGKSCDDLMDETKTDLNIKKAILNVPLAMETAYRPAFIVAVTKFDGQAQENNPKNNVTIGTQNKDTVDADHFYVVDYLELKVPAFGTDIVPPEAPKSNPDKNNSARDTYEDPLKLTADLLQPIDKQQAAKDEETADRQKVRQEGGDQVKDRGEYIGKNGEPIYCNQDGKLINCSKDNPDKLPSALIAFINAHKALGTKENLPCEPNSADFYSPDNKKKIAEQAREIGSSLEAQDKVGDYVKKKEAKVQFSVDIKDVRNPMDFHTDTELYFVSPDSYALKYARDSFLSFLTTNDQGKLQQLGLADASEQISPESFSPLLKTDINDKVNSSETQRGGYSIGAQPAAGDTTSNQSNTQGTNQGPPQQGFFIDSVKIAPLDQEGQPKDHPLFWQYAGQVANLPTRLVALVTTPLDHPVNQYTQSCTNAANPNEFATEDWLLGRCKAQPPVTQTGSTCKVDETVVTTCSNWGTTCGYTPPPTAPKSPGQTAQVSDGVIALALQVSKYTCTPAEMIIGVLAKETSSLTFDNQPLTGDPNQLAYRVQACSKLNPADPNSAAYYADCSAFSYTQGELEDQISGYSAQITDCLNNLQNTLSKGTIKLDMSDHDARKLGVSMCVASANIWRGMYCWNYKGPGNCNAQKATGYTCSGDTRKAYQLSDFSEETIRKGIDIIHCSSFDCSKYDNAEGNYWDFINQYKTEVSKVRGELAACVQ